jgi:hypothetical protein
MAKPPSPNCVPSPLAVADGALAKGLMGREEFARAADAMRGPGRQNARLVAANVHDGAASFLESMVRALLLTQQIEGFEPQLRVETSAFGVRVDLGLVHLLAGGG